MLVSWIILLSMDIIISPCLAYRQMQAHWGSPRLEVDAPTRKIKKIVFYFGWSGIYDFRNAQYWINSCWIWSTGRSISGEYYIQLTRFNNCWLPWPGWMRTFTAQYCSLKTFLQVKFNDCVQPQTVVIFWDYFIASFLFGNKTLHEGDHVNTHRHLLFTLLWIVVINGKSSDFNVITSWVSLAKQMFPWSRLTPSTSNVDVHI